MLFEKQLLHLVKFSYYNSMILDAVHFPLPSLHFIPECHQRGYLGKLCISGSASLGERNQGGKMKNTEHLLRAPRPSVDDDDEHKSAAPVPGLNRKS